MNCYEIIYLNLMQRMGAQLPENHKTQFNHVKSRWGENVAKMAEIITNLIHNCHFAPAMGGATAIMHNQS